MKNSYKGIFTILCVFIIVLACSNSEVLERYENGNVKVEAELKEGLLHGIRKSYYEEGGLMTYGTYQFGKKNGNFKYYYKSGKLEQEVFYQNDLRKGILKDYYESGRIKAEAMYHLDTLDGSLIRYYENGETEFDGIFEKGENVAYEQYDSLGVLVDWKMDFLITHEYKNDSILELNFSLKNKKFDILRVEMSIYSNDELLTKFEENSKSSIINSIFEVPSNNQGFTFLGRFLDIEVLSDSSGAIIKNTHIFEYEIKP